MQAEFWQQCWQQQRIGFHQTEVHPLLPVLTQQLQLSSSVSTFVPLCGKSLDMLWWRQFGSVVGAELSELACQQFFLEAGFAASCQSQGAHQLYSAEQISLWQGDYFALESSQLGPVGLIYDRAALIALPDAMRTLYVEKLKQLCPAASLLLLTLDYPAAEMQGPPFAIPDHDVHALFRFAQSVELLAVRDLTGRPFAQRQFKVSRLIERAYLIRW
ncbi:thiopurine S-methyltransferase [Rheinheimera marina]|uniref:Thiopurine S-methyltransferase n=1 Tax=Rheinheimera marina TaxID=1774958 RepID=A0ABV9JR86_9GAMM